ncbi:MAG TPA: ATP-binding protein [Candidatus Dormibacteraeota bacterium]
MSPGRPRRRARPLRVADDRLRTVLDGVGDAILIRQLPEDVITFWNQGAAETYGWSASEVRGKVAHALLQTSFPVPVETIMCRLRQTGHWRGQLRQRRRGGMEAVVESRWTLLPGAVPEQLMEVDRDVTRPAAMEIALREVEQHLRSVFDHSPLGICTVALDGRVLTANPTLHRMLRMEAGGAQTHAFAGIVHVDDGAAVRAMFARTATGGAQPVAVEARLRRADGSVLWARLSASVVTDPSGGPRFHVAMVEDIDERRQVDAAMERVNARLEALNRDKGRLLSEVSHEFRTALTSIQGFSELLRDQDLGPQEVRELARDINGEALRLDRLIEDLLDLDRMESGAAPLHRQPVEVNPVVTALADRMRRTAPDHPVVLRLAEGLPAIQAEPDRLTQVFTNLLSNAVKYSPAGSPIEVSSELIGDRVRVTVRDGGPGIPADWLERVFDRYTRLERDSRVEGTGLGLPIVRQIVQMHGGSVSAENAAGGGALITVELPVSGGPEVPGDAGANRVL